ncbi:DMT family transporter [Candidatus Bealeia paramacronuclearis]|uniref:DMT family transporter n=1 Tax=Candidatus Bealeia paramacronuclearis TaxID=1921001 RepID=A0ABZ2C1K0_9PROT|nr:DMT family transporter [Candidatus Bealeia paramacronuclearis]
MPKIQSPLWGMFYMCLAMLVFSILNAIVKDTTTLYPPIQLVTFRCLFAALFCVGLMFFKGRRISSPLVSGKLHLFRGILLAVALTSLFWGIGPLPLANSIALYFSSTFFLVILSYPILKEKVESLQWGAVAIGFIGVLIIAKPSGDVMHWAALGIIAGAGLEEAYNLFGRKLSLSIDPLSLTFWGSLIPGLFTLFVLPFYWVEPDLGGWISLMMLGIGGGIGQLCISHAYLNASAGTVAPIIYTSMLWSAVLDIFLYGNYPTPHLLLGCAVVISSGLFIVYRELKAPQIKSV